MPKSYRARWALLSVVIVLIGTLMAVITGLATGRTGLNLLGRGFPIGFVINVVFAVAMGWSITASIEEREKRSVRDDEDSTSAPD